MPSPVVRQFADAHCQHSGRAHPAQVSTRVLVEGNAVVLVEAPWTVQGCTAPAPDTCTSAQFVTGSIRVRVAGRAVVLAASSSVVTANGSALTFRATEQRVVAS